MSGAATKEELRRRFRAARRALDPATRAAATAAACAALDALIARLRPPALASYAALGGELDLDALHRRRWADGATVWLPRVHGETLTWHELGSAAGLEDGAFGIREPGDAVPAGVLPPGALVLVPGVAFAADGHRLGQGRGFYDRALAGLRAISVGVGFACQRCDGLPHEAHDHPLDGVLLDGELLRAPLAP